MKIIAGERITAGDLVYFIERDGLLYAYKVRAEGDTLVAEPEAPAAPAEKPTPDEEKEESEEEIRKRARKPPSEGPCKMCEQVKPLNRLLLCYECWLKDKLHKDSGGDWLPGDPHPAGCGCDGPGGCSTKNQGN